MATISRTIQLHPVQRQFRQSKASTRGFVGGRGAGKSWVLNYDLIRRAKRGRTYMMASPTGILMKDTTFPTFTAIAYELGVLQPGGIRLSPYPNVTLSTGATIRFRTAEDPERLRGPNLSGVALDEASLMHGDAYKIAIACLREGGEQGWLTASFTPKGFANWTFDVFGKPHPDTECFHSRTADNPFNPADFQDKLALAYTATEQRQELEGEFVDTDEAMQVIPTAWVRAAMDRWRPDGHGGRVLSALGVDVARGGEAKTVLAPRHSNWFNRLLKYPGATTPDGPAVGQLIAMALGQGKNPQARINMDMIGIGAAVLDECRRRKLSVIGVNFAGHTSSTDSTGLIRFSNIRAFAYWQMRDALDPRRGHNIQLPPDEELMADLIAAHWEATSAGVKIENKEDIAERLGRSPDCGDAVVYACIMPAK